MSFYGGRGHHRTIICTNLAFNQFVWSTVILRVWVGTHSFADRSVEAKVNKFTDVNEVSVLQKIPAIQRNDKSIRLLKANQIFVIRVMDCSAGSNAYRTKVLNCSTSSPATMNAGMVSR